MIPMLHPDPQSPFPPTVMALTEPNGLLAHGGDLDPVRLRRAYRLGIFPWSSHGQPLLWWSPAPRAVIPPAEVHVSRRLRRRLRQRPFELRADQHFNEVIRACAGPRDERLPMQAIPDIDPQGWITPDMIKAYELLHQQGVAHSIEVMQDGKLAGGLYGLAIGGVFFAESMVSMADDASKVALVSLCRVLAQHGFALLDCQVMNPHLGRMGAVEWPREKFEALLAQETERGELIGDWDAAMSKPLGW